MISTEIPFSRSMFSSASIISEFMASLNSSSASRRHRRLRRLRLARLRSRTPFEHRVARHDVAVCDALTRTFDLDVDAVVIGPDEDAAAADDRAFGVARLQRDR